MTRDNSGIRQLVTINVPQPSSMKARTRKQSQQMGEAGYIPKEVSMMSLKQRSHVMAAESKTSIQFGLNKSPSLRGELARSPSLNKFDESAGLPFRQIVKDQSVTHLSNGPLVSDLGKSTDKMPTVSQVLASMSSKANMQSKT